MLKTRITIIAVLFALGCKSQTTEVTEKYVLVSDTTIYEVVERMPEFPGGHRELLKYLSNNIKVSTVPLEEILQSRFVAKFVVEKDGNINHIKVVRSVHEEIDKEYLRVIRTMPKWKPGIHEGDTVRVWYAIPVWIRFQ